MTGWRNAAVAALLLVCAQPAAARNGRSPTAVAQRGIVKQYLTALESGRYRAAYELLNAAARSYYRDAENYASIFAADRFRITSFRLVGASPERARGRVFFARETARYRDHAHDADLVLTATVPVGVIADGGVWRIKDPGHPWRAFATDAFGAANGVRVIVKKISFFERRIEAVVTFVNAGSVFVTVLPYGKSLLRDSGGRFYHPIETRDWSLTDRTLFEGLRLAPDAQYTGALAFGSNPLDNAARTFSLTLAPLLCDGADVPFAIEIRGIGAEAIRSNASPR